MITFLIIVTVLGSIFFIYLFYLTSIKSEEEKEYERKQKAYLEEDFFIDPQTGAKFTLEQAESGHWISHDNEHLPISEAEIERLYTSEQKDIVRTINHLRISKDYKKHQFSEVETEFLINSNTLGKYGDWSYSNCFRLENGKGFVFIPCVHENDVGQSAGGYFSSDYSESQLMFWIFLDQDYGHYFLREKSKTEKFLDLIRNDDDLKLKGYESFTITPTTQVITLLHILKEFEEEKGIELEVINQNLLVKTTKAVNMDGFNRVESLISKII